MRKYIAIVLILLCTLQCEAARNWYFATSGSDAGLGTIGSPYKTITKCNAIFSTFSIGDSVLFKCGDTFIGTITVTKSGTSPLPIVISSYGIGAKPIITSLVSITGWVAGGSGIYTAAANSSLLTTCNIVLMNNVLQELGRFPDAGSANAGYLTYQNHTGQTAIISSSLSGSTWTGASAYVRSGKFFMNTVPVSVQSGNTLTFGTALLGTPVNNSGFFITKDIRTCTVNGEWFFKVSTKQISMFNGSTPTNVTATSLQSLISSSSFSFITVDGLDLRGANFNAVSITNGSGWNIKNTDINWSGNYAISDDGSSNITIQNCTIENSLTEGIRLNNVNGASVVSNSIHNTAQHAGMQGTNGQVGYGIQHLGSSSTFSNNTVINTGYTGISSVHAGTSVGSDILIKNNVVDTFCNVTNDGGGIYTVDASQVANTNVVWEGNIVSNGIGAVPGTADNFTSAEGLYADNDATGVTITGNTVSRCQRGIYLHFATLCNVWLNTSYDNVYQFYAESRTADLLRTCIVTRNKFVARTAAQYSGYFKTDATNIQNDIKQFFTRCDSNYYCRPINQTSAPAHMRNSNTNVSLPTWQGLYNSTVRTPPYDVHSFIAPRAITNDGQLAFYTNPTSIAINVVLSGTWIDMTNASYSGTITLQPFTSLVLINTGTQTTPTITWANPAAITYGTALSGTQLNASTGIAGTFTYTPPSGTILNAGTQTLSVTFTPTNTTLYTSATKTVTIVVNKASATMSYVAPLTVVYNGLPQGVNVVTNPLDLHVITTLYNGLGATPLNAGVYNMVTALTNANYTAPNITGVFTITKATATLTASNLTQTYNGSPRPIIVTTSPTGLSGVAITYNGSSTAPTNAGTYTVVVTLTNNNYTATSLNTTLTINKATPTVSWTTPSAITFGTALSGTQLNATASVAGTFTYTPASGAVLNAGTQTLSVDFTPTDGTNYNSVNNTTVNLVVNKASATLSLSNLAQTYDGTGKSATVTSSPVGLNVISVTYNGSATLPINAGTYAVIATLTNPNYTATPATGNLVIAKAAATITLTGLTTTYDGSPHAVTATTAPLGLATVTITYDESSTAPTNAGSYAVIASLSNTNYQATNATGTLVINKATPNVTWNNPSAITYGTALSGTQLNATADVAGSFTYTPVSGTILNAGTQTLSVNFTPTDATNYNNVSNVTVTIVVNKVTATISLSNLAQEFDGNPKPVTVTTNPVGLGTITVTYNGSGTVPSAVGTYAVIASLSNTNYTATPATGNLVISSPTAIVTITDNVQTYTGSQLNVTVTVTGGYPYDLTYNGSATAPTNVGTYTAIATINDGIHVGADTALFTINKATPSITWANPSAITFGTALSGTQLNASSGTAGTFIYTPASGAILNAGTQILSVAFTPTDAANYNTTSKTVSLVVNKATATITLSALTQVYDGTQKFAIATTSPAGLDVVAITYDGSSTAPSAVNSYAVVATLTNSNYTATPATGTLEITTAIAGIEISNILQTYTGSTLPVTVTTNPTGLTYTVTYNASATVPTNAGSYTVIATLTGGIYVGADTQTLVISKAIPVVTWATPSDITFGTALSGTQLSASANVAGAFVYSPVSGTVLNVGNGQVLATTFTPTDATNYVTINKTVLINVLGGTATLTLSNLSAQYNGLPHAATVVTSPVGLSGVVITYDGSVTVPTNAGAYAVQATLTNDNYTATPVNGTLVIAKANATLTWNQPTSIVEFTPLTTIQLNATSNIAGTFSYSYPIGTVLPAGSHIMTAAFTPTSSNYAVTTISVTISVYGNSIPSQDFYERNGQVEYIEIP